MSKSISSVIGFTNADLIENRWGVISYHQRPILLGKGLLPAVGYAIAGILAVVMIIGQFSESTNAAGTANGFKLMALTLGVPLTCLFLGMSMFRVRSVLLDVESGIVNRIEGVPYITHVVNKGGIRYSIKVNDRLFQIPQAAADLLGNNKTWRIYYAPHTRIVLSAERR